MTANFDMIQKVYEGYRDNLEKARKVLNHPMTYTEKILYAHLWETTKTLAPPFSIIEMDVFRRS